MAFGTRSQFEPIRQINAASIGGPYTALGTALIDHARLIRIVSTLNTEVYISLDGVSDNMRLASGSFLLLDLSSNKIRDDGLFISMGTIFYVKSVSVPPATGAVWLEVMYGAGGI
jgi:hypothetical protein